MLRFEHVSFQYDGDGAPMLEDLSFTVEKGEFVCLVGPSGAGKSTIFRLINRLLTPSSGRILVDGRDIREQKRYCGYMPQSDLLFPWRSVRENVRLPLEIRGGKTKQEMDEEAGEALRNAGLSGWEDRAPRELSGGMRQRAAFARTILTGTELMLLDEPFSALDYLTRLSMRQWLLDQWERDRKTVLFITHDVEEALFLSGRILAVRSVPITELESVNVPAGRPRTADVLKKPEILDLKDRLIGMLGKGAP